MAYLDDLDGNTAALRNYHHDLDAAELRQEQIQRDAQSLAIDYRGDLDLLTEDARNAADADGDWQDHALQVLHEIYDLTVRHGANPAKVAIPAKAKIEWLFERIAEHAVRNSPEYS